MSTETQAEPEEIADLRALVRHGTTVVDTNLPLSERVSAGVIANVRFGVEELKQVSSLRESIHAEQLTVLGSVFQLVTGRVDFLP